MNNKKIESLITDLLTELGEDPQREGLKKTPQRVAKMFIELTKGYRTTRQETINDALFTERVHNMIVLKDIELYSLCEHHLLPFFGKCHIGYIPKDTIIGVSKIARIVDRFANRMQVQERLTQEIAKEIEEALSPYGVGVIIEAQHLCMMMRGVEKQNAATVTSVMMGDFRSNATTRSEFLNMVGR